MTGTGQDRDRIRVLDLGLMDKSRALKRFTILFLGSAVFYLVLGVVTLAWSVVARLPPPNPAPSLAGVTPAPVASTTPIFTLEPHLGSFGVPAGWSRGGASGGVEGGNGSRVYVYSGTLPGGVALATAADRKRAASIEARIRHAKVLDPVELTVGGRNVVEVAGIDESELWTLHVFVFADRAYAEVTCHAFGHKSNDSFLRQQHKVDWESALPGCAAVVASVKATQ
jgi:hypothetical protein